MEVAGGQQLVVHIMVSIQEHLYTLQEQGEKPDDNGDTQITLLWPHIQTPNKPNLFKLNAQARKQRVRERKEESARLSDASNEVKQGGVEREIQENSPKKSTNNRNSRTIVGMPYCPFSDKVEGEKLLPQTLSYITLWWKASAPHKIQEVTHTNMNESKGLLYPIVI